MTNFKEGYILSVQTASLFILFYAPNKHLVPFNTMETRFNVQLYFSISTIFIFLVGLYENCIHYLLKVLRKIDSISQNYITVLKYIPIQTKVYYLICVIFGLHEVFLNFVVLKIYLIVTSYTTKFCFRLKIVSLLKYMRNDYLP